MAKTPRRSAGNPRRSIFPTSSESSTNDSLSEAEVQEGAARRANPLTRSSSSSSSSVSSSSSERHSPWAAMTSRRSSASSAGRTEEQRSENSRLLDDERPDQYPETTFAQQETDDSQERELTPRERRRILLQAQAKRRRRRTLVAASILLSFTILITLITFGLRQLLGMNERQSYDGPGETSVSFTVAKGEGISQIIADLKNQDIIASEQAFSKALGEQANGAQIQPGKYQLKTKMNNDDVVKALLRNDLSRVFYVPIAGNMRVNEVLEALAKNTRVSISQFEDLNKKPTTFGVSSKAKNLEGYLAPGEYRFPQDASPQEMLQEMVNRQKKILEDQDITNPDEQYRMLTMASIVEAEGNKTNYAKIAGALYNRVDRPNEDTGGLINSDATVTYGLGKRSLHITEEQKKDKSNPYNTYANKGLPVGPIGSPSKAALEATIKPDKNDYYYWVTINIKTGETLYAKTYEEHKVNEQKYLKYCADNPGVCGGEE